MAKRSVSCTVFGITVGLMALVCVAVGLLVFYLGCPEKKKNDDLPMTTTTISPLPPQNLNLRLPRSLSPTKYQLWLQPYFPAPDIDYPVDRNFTFDGDVQIDIDCLESTQNITLHMYKINLKNETKLFEIESGSESNRIDISNQVYDKRTHLVTFFLKSSLRKGQKYRLRLTYVGHLIAADLAGFYPSSYLENGELKWLVATQFEPTDARRALPCFDEPSYKAVFQVQIKHPSALKAISNGMETDTTKQENGWSLTTFEPTEKMSTYLLAFAVCDFKSKESYTKDNKTLFRVWARPSLINETDYAVKAGPKVLDYYEQYFNVSFPLRKQDMLAIPDFAAGAMENWGLVTYRESALLYDEKTYASTNRQRVAVVIAHELAHQWFGDLVTMAWWDDLWLNEGFARYMEYVGSDVIADKAFHMDQQFVATLFSAMKVDQLSTSHPIVVTVSTPDEINAIFDDISYNKGGSILRMLMNTLSEDVFKRGLHIYLTKHKYGNANHNDLWSALTETVNGKVLDWNNEPLNVSDYMNPWIMQMGYPILNVRRTYERSNEAVITQERYLLSGNNSGKSRLKYDSSPFNYTWYVPVWYQNKPGDQAEFTWLQPNQPLQISGLTDQWLLLNHDVLGYFRVNYDERNWQLLQNQLLQNNEVINVNNRAQLLDDAFNLARAGYLNYETALNTTLYLIKETSYVPWQAAKNGFNFLEDMLILSPEYQYYRDYLLNLMMPLYDRTGWDDSKEDLDDVLAHYARVVSKSTLCDLGYPDCLQKAKDLFEKFLKTCAGKGAVSSICSQVPTNLRKTVYCAGGGDDNVEWWNLLWQLHAREQGAVEKENLMYGLCCTRSPSLLIKLLDEAIDPNSTIVRRQDSKSVFSNIGTNDVGRVLLWGYLEDNWDTLSFFAQSGIGSSLGVAFTAATRSFNSEFQAKMLDEFYRKNQNLLGSAATSVRQQIESVNANVNWVKKYRDTVVRWLKVQVRD